MCLYVFSQAISLCSAKLLVDYPCITPHMHQQVAESQGVKLTEKLRGVKLKALLENVCPEKSFLWDSL